MEESNILNPECECPQIVTLSELVLKECHLKLLISVLSIGDKWSNISVTFAILIIEELT
jgi:hypothetical protein